MNLIRITIAPLLLLLVALLTGCDGADASDESLTLEVTVSDWNGWDEDYEPTPHTTTVEVHEGSTFEVEAMGDDITFEVTEFDDEQVELEANSNLASRNPGGGIDMNDTVDEFTLDRNGTLELVTPTMDAGTNITIEEA